MITIQKIKPKAPTIAGLQREVTPDAALEEQPRGRRVTITRVRSAGRTAPGDGDAGGQQRSKTAAAPRGKDPGRRTRRLSTRRRARISPGTR